jgi:ArsR family transcriptional regulator, arsenate/arsenite/antimonite-responsive transcriptional repressor
MDQIRAVSCLTALAHEQRLAIFRLLVKEGPNGLTAGVLGQAVGASPTAASFHLKELDRAGLIHATRDGRYIRYAVHVEGMRRLLEFLTEDCCQGNPELCGSTLGSVRGSCATQGVSK